LEVFIIKALYKIKSKIQKP